MEQISHFCLIQIIKRTGLLSRFSLFFILLFSGNAFAYEAFFEYGHFDGTTSPEFISPYLLNIEYQTDIISYENTPGDIYDFIRYPTVLFLSGGSANRHHFLLDNRFKFTKTLSADDSISFLVQKKRNFEEKTNLTVVEYRRYFGDFFSGIYVDPDFTKQNISLGMNLNYLHDNSLFRLFATKVDIFRNVRSDLYPDKDPLVPSFRFYDHAHQPVTLGLVNRIWSADIDKNDPKQFEGWGNFLEYGIKYDTPTYWRFETDNYLYTYEKVQAFLNTGYRLSDYNLFFNAEYTDKKENYEVFNSSLPDKAFYHGNLHTRKYENKAEIKTPVFENFFSLYLTGGYDYVYRNWKTQKSDLTLLNNVLYSSVNFPLRNKNIWLSVMLLQDWYQQQGYWNDIEISEKQKDYSSHGDGELTRANLVLRYHWLKDSFVSALTSISVTPRDSIYGGTSLKYECFF